MKRQVYEIDAHGYLKEIYVKEFDEQGCKEELSDNMITIDPPQGLYRARWTGTEWVEDMSYEEIKALNNKPKAPTVEERLQATEEAILAMMEVLG